MRNKTSLVGGAALGVMLACGLGVAAHAQDTTTAWKGAPQFTNDSLTFKVRGRVYIDAVNQSVDRTGSGVDFDAFNTRLRTARIGVEGTWNSQWAYKAEASISSGGGTTQWEDLTLEYKPTEFTSIVVGNFKTVSLEDITSSRYNTMMERGAFNDFINAGRVMNLQFKANGANWTAGVAVSGDSLNSADVATNSGTGSSETFGYNGRATFAPIVTDTTTLHLGVWGRYRDRNDQANFTYQVRNNTNYGARYTSTGAIGVSDKTIGLEGALLYKNFSLQSEYARITADRAGTASDVDLDGFYVTGSVFLTGETRRYEAARGEFNRTRILNPLTAGGMGAWELAVRYDNTDLTDLKGVATAGKYTAWTGGVNWYPHPYVRFMANYSRSKNDNPTLATGANRELNDVDVDTFQMRAQFDF